MVRLKYEGNLENIKLAKFKIDFIRGETKEVTEDVADYALQCGGFKKEGDDSNEKYIKEDKKEDYGMDIKSISKKKQK